VTFVAEIGDLRRFDNPHQLMAFLGLVPSERSTGERVRRGGLTLAGNRRARRVLIEGAWSYRYPARVSQTLQARLEGLPKAVREIAWKAANSPVRPLSPAQRRRQEAARGDCCDRPRRDGGVSVGHRPPCRARGLIAENGNGQDRPQAALIRLSSVFESATPVKAGPAGRR